MASSDEYLDFRMATVEDAGLLVDLYNASFFSDYQRFGTCPGYGKNGRDDGRIHTFISEAHHPVRQSTCRMYIVPFKRFAGI